MRRQEGEKREEGERGGGAGKGSMWVPLRQKASECLCSRLSLHIRESLRKGVDLLLLSFLCQFEPPHFREGVGAERTLNLHQSVPGHNQLRHTLWQ